ncbi:uncharacterized protein LOC117222961 [Megalopta genalis]|uniref:uncharacterized protein LOC117222961 n=1 Tax=Megalopta genalis TaxID=115081 RepID=UPI003FD30B2B
MLALLLRKVPSKASLTLLNGNKPRLQFRKSASQRNVPAQFLQRNFDLQESKLLSQKPGRIQILSDCLDLVCLNTLANRSSKRLSECTFDRNLSDYQTFPRRYDATCRAEGKPPLTSEEANFAETEHSLKADCLKYFGDATAGNKQESKISEYPNYWQGLDADYFQSIRNTSPLCLGSIVRYYSRDVVSRRYENKSLESAKKQECQPEDCSNKKDYSRGEKLSDCYENAEYSSPQRECVHHEYSTASESWDQQGQRQQCQRQKEQRQCEQQREQQPCRQEHDQQECQCQHQMKDERRQQVKSQERLSYQRQQQQQRHRQRELLPQRRQQYQQQQHQQEEQQCQQQLYQEQQEQQPCQHRQRQEQLHQQPQNTHQCRQQQQQHQQCSQQEQVQCPCHQQQQCRQQQEQQSCQGQSQQQQIDYEYRPHQEEEHGLHQRQPQKEQQQLQYQYRPYQEQQQDHHQYQPQQEQKQCYYQHQSQQEQCQYQHQSQQEQCHYQHQSQQKEQQCHYQHQEQQQKQQQTSHEQQCQGRGRTDGQSSRYSQQLDYQPKIAVCNNPPSSSGQEGYHQPTYPTCNAAQTFPASTSQLPSIQQPASTSCNQQTQSFRDKITRMCSSRCKERDCKPIDGEASATMKRFSSIKEGLVSWIWKRKSPETHEKDSEVPTCRCERPSTEPNCETCDRLPPKPNHWAQKKQRTRALSCGPEVYIPYESSIRPQSKHRSSQRKVHVDELIQDPIEYQPMKSASNRRGFNKVWQESCTSNPRIVRFEDKKDYQTARKTKTGEELRSETSFATLGSSSCWKPAGTFKIGDVSNARPNMSTLKYRLTKCPKVEQMWQQCKCELPKVSVKPVALPKPIPVRRRKVQPVQSTGEWREQKYPVRLKIFKSKSTLDPCLPTMIEISKDRNSSLEMPKVKVMDGDSTCTSTTKNEPSLMRECGDCGRKSKNACQP